MKKLVLLAAFLAAMVVFAAIPAVAQVTQEGEQEAESGDAEQSFEVTGGGDSANQCAEILGTAQTGNAANSTGALQAGGEDNEIEVDDSGSLTISPALAEKCEQEINQAASTASSKTETSENTPKTAPSPKGEETKTATSSEDKADAAEAKAEAKAVAKTGEKKELPKTGGGNAEVFLLAVGVLLVAGGLIARGTRR